MAEPKIQPLLEFVVYRTPKGFRVVGKIMQPLDTFSMPVQLRIDTEGNPELKSLRAVLRAMGMQLTVRPLRKRVA